MLKRSEKGKLIFQSLDFQIFLGDLFEECKTEEEIEWLKDQITEHTEGIAEERIEEL